MQEALIGDEGQGLQQALMRRSERRNRVRVGYKRCKSWAKFGLFASGARAAIGDGKEKAQRPQQVAELARRSLGERAGGADAHQIVGIAHRSLTAL